MTALALPPETAASIRRLQTDLRLWVLTLVAWLAGVIPSRGMRLLLQQSIREARQDLKLLIFAKLLLRLQTHRRVSDNPQIHQPAAMSAPPGFRLVRRRTKTLDLATRGIALRTLRDMRHVIENIDAVVRRAWRRLPTHFLTRKLVAVRIPACVRESCGPAPAAEAADTS